MARKLIFYLGTRSSICRQEAKEEVVKGQRYVTPPFPHTLLSWPFHITSVSRCMALRALADSATFQ